MRYPISELLFRWKKTKVELQNLNDRFDGKIRTPAFYRDYAYLKNRLQAEEHKINQYGCNFEVYRITFKLNDEPYYINWADISETEIIPLVTIRYPNATEITYNLIPMGTLLKL